MSFTVQVWVKAGSTQGPKIVTGEDSQLIVYVKESAQNGRANEAVRKILAKHFGTPVAAVVLNKGAKARYKTFTIHQ